MDTTDSTFNNLIRTYLDAETNQEKRKAILDRIALFETLLDGAVNNAEIISQQRDSDDSVHQKQKNLKALRHQMRELSTPTLTAVKVNNVIVNCPHCDVEIQLRLELAGKKQTCIDCSNDFFLGDAEDLQFDSLN
ncbi:hypothetical protein [Enterovibrio norvegicus]|uniref:hypothetical protein n=1 Tax=Enterovibrio norvegicus TaxID=188144 RepID=UPI00352D97C2